MNRRTLKDLDAQLGRRRVGKARAAGRRKLQVMLLADLRKQLGFTQTAVARAMGVSQSALSQFESQDDPQLSPLRRPIQALGGELDRVARFGDRSIILAHAASA